MQNGRYAEAEQVYREDLARLPGNGWSPYGLAESLSVQKKDAAEAKATRAKFQELWAKADTKIANLPCINPARNRSRQTIIVSINLSASLV
jgi:hypothetical protein